MPPGQALPPPSFQSTSNARATIRIVEGARISQSEWIRTARRKEIVIPDRNGRPVLVRLIEFE